MKWFLYFFFLLISIAFLSLLYIQDPGHIEITWLGYEIQLSAIAGILTLLFVFCLISIVRLFASWLLGIPFHWISIFKRGRERKAKNELLKILSSFEAENLSESLLHQKKAGPSLLNDPFFLWISGNAFEKASKPLEAEECFGNLAKHPLSTFLGLKGQIRVALQRGDTKSASILLEQAYKLVPTSPWVLKHLLDLARQQADLKKAEALTLRLEDLGYFSPENSKKQIGYLQYLNAVQPETSLSERENLLRQSHRLDPTSTETAINLAELLFEQRSTREALQILKTTWSLKPAQSLGTLYLTISSPKSEIEAYQAANQLVDENPQSSEGLFLLTRTALKAKLWGEARAHLIELLKKDPSTEAHLLFAFLELEENQNLKAAMAWLEETFKVPFKNILVT